MLCYGRWVVLLYSSVPAGLLFRDPQTPNLVLQYTFHDFSPTLELHLSNSSSVTPHFLKLCQLLGSGVLCENPRLFLSFTSSISLFFSPCVPGWIFCFLHFSLQTWCHTLHSEYLGEAAGGSSFHLLTRYSISPRVCSAESCPSGIASLSLMNLRCMRNLIFFSHTCQYDTFVSCYGPM